MHACMGKVASKLKEPGQPSPTDMHVGTGEKSREKMLHKESYSSDIYRMMKHIHFDIIISKAMNI